MPYYRTQFPDGCKTLARVTNMTQPHWSAIFFGGSGIAGVVALVTNGITSQKNERIKYLEKKNQDLILQVSEERTKASRILEEFNDHLKSLDIDRFGAADKLRIQEVFGLLNKFSSTLEGYRDCERAAEWLDHRKQEWASEATERAVRRYKHLFLLPRRTAKFREDIERYLEWVQLGLSKYGGRTQNASVYEFIESPAVSSFKPYVFAVRYLMDVKDFSKLEEKPSLYLRTVLDRSIEQLESEFSQGQDRRKRIRSS